MTHLNPYVPILILLILAFVIAWAMIGASSMIAWLLRLNRPSSKKLQPYECGMTPIGGARVRFSIKFYLVAMLFILFDLEIVFMYPWAVVYKETITHSSVIFWSMLSFISILMVGYVYALKKGALDWRK